MSGEFEPGVPDRYNLESYQIDWSTISPKQEDPDRWSFTVQGREQGRKVGYLYAQAVDAVLGYDATNGGRQRLEDPDPIDDCRLLGQISFSEYDDDFGNSGPISVVELYMRNSSQDPEGFQRFQAAMQALIDQAESAISS